MFKAGDKFTYMIWRNNGMHKEEYSEKYFHFLQDPTPRPIAEDV